MRRKNFFYIKQIDSMDTENSKADLMQGHCLENLSKEIVKIDKTGDKNYGVKFSSIPYIKVEGDVVTDENCRLPVASNPSSTEENNIDCNIDGVTNPSGNPVFHYEALSKSELLDLAKRRTDYFHCKQIDKLDAEPTEANFIQRDALNDLSIKVVKNNKSEHKSCQVKFSEEFSTITQGDIVVDNKCSTSFVASSPSTTGDSFVYCNCDCARTLPDTNSVLHNEATPGTEFRNLARNSLAFLIGFCIGLLYGLFNSYTNASISDLYVTIYFVIYLILYIIFF